jgi:hypothetical protein
MNRFLISVLLSLVLGCGGDGVDLPADALASGSAETSTETSADALSVGDDVTDPIAPSDDVVMASDADAVSTSEGDMGTSPPDATVAMADGGETPQPDGGIVAEADVSGPGDDVPMMSDAEASWPEGLHGTVPGAALPAPEFAAINHDGSARGPDDLMGKPTVMWFFPFAGTPG